MKNLADARELARSLVRVGAAAGVDVVALLTDMDAPLGRSIGNRLEVLEAVQVLRGQGPADLCEVIWALGAEMLMLAGVATDVGAARARLDAAVADGGALASFRRNIVRQGGDPAFVDDARALGTAPATLGIASTCAGHVADVDPMALGLCAMDLGAGRRQPSDTIDPHVGIVLIKQLGDRVERGEPLALVHARSLDDASAALPRVLDAFEIGDEPSPRPLVLERIADA
jgi:thymidine phosphorylase